MSKQRVSVGEPSAAAEVILRGGMVVDGSGAEPFRADVALAAGRILAVGDLTTMGAAAEVDATDRYVIPGLIDAHSHADGLLDDDRLQRASLAQGVTTMIVGQDGVGFAPTGTASATYAADYFAAINGQPRETWRGGLTTADYLDALDGASALNAATLIPVGGIRAEVVGLLDRPATAGELTRMTRLVEEAVEAGALGVSTGLDYVPGGFASTEELSAICAPVGRAGGVYVSHLRGYRSDQIAGALREAAQIAAASGAKPHASHLHGSAGVLVPALEDAEVVAGAAFTFDSYPYLRGNTIVAMIALPAELQEGGAEATLARLADPHIRTALADVLAANPRVATITVTFAAASDYRWVEGLGLHEAADRAGSTLVDFVCDLLIACRLAVGCVVDNGADRTEQDVRAMLRDARHVGSSDGIFLGSHPHPRGWGAFSRMLGRHTRELGDWSWGEAVRHLSGAPAERFGLGDRGRIADGAIADVVVLDPRTVADQSSYAEPTRQAVGVEYVFVAGRAVWRLGELTGERSGRAIRHWTGRGR